MFSPDSLSASAATSSITNPDFRRSQLLQKLLNITDEKPLPIYHADSLRPIISTLGLRIISIKCAFALHQFSRHFNPEISELLNQRIKIYQSLVNKLDPYDWEKAQQEYDALKAELSTEAERINAAWSSARHDLIHELETNIDNLPSKMSYIQTNTAQITVLLDKVKIALSDLQSKKQQFDSETLGTNVNLLLTSHNKKIQANSDQLLMILAPDTPTPEKSPTVFRKTPYPFSTQSMGSPQSPRLTLFSNPDTHLDNIFKRYSEIAESILQKIATALECTIYIDQKGLVSFAKQKIQEFDDLLSNDIFQNPEQYQNARREITALRDLLAQEIVSTDNITEKTLNVIIHKMTDPMVSPTK